MDTRLFVFAAWKPSAETCLLWIGRKKVDLPKKRFFFGGLIVLIIFLDQLTKWVIRQYLSLYQSIVVIPNFFNITYLRNPGAAFGILSQANPLIIKPLFFVLSVVAIVAMAALYYKAQADDRLTRSAMCLIFSGAAGNIIDRLTLGEVVDFLDFYLYAYHWPAFNIADISISVGVGLFIISLWRKG